MKDCRSHDLLTYGGFLSVSSLCLFPPCPIDHSHVKANAEAYAGGWFHTGDQVWEIISSTLLFVLLHIFEIWCSTWVSFPIFLNFPSIGMAGPPGLPYPHRPYQGAHQPRGGEDLSTGGKSSAQGGLALATIYP